MKKTSMKLIIFLISIILINIPLEYLNNTSAGSESSFPYQPTDEVIIAALDYLNSQQAKDGSIGCFTVSSGLPKLSFNNARAGCIPRC